MGVFVRRVPAVRAFGASAPRLRTVKTFLQTLPAIQEIPRELHGCRVLAVASVLAPLRPYGSRCST